MTLPATDPASPSSASTLEVVNQRKPGGRGGLAVPILLGVAVIGALAVVGVRQGAFPLPPASVPARPSEGPGPVAPAAVLPSPNAAAPSAPIEAPRGAAAEPARPSMPSAPAAPPTSGASHDGAAGEATSTAAARDRAVHRRLLASAKAVRGSPASAANRGGTSNASKPEALDPTPASPPLRAEAPKPVAVAGTDAPARAVGDEKPSPPLGGAGASTPQARGAKEMVAEGEKLLAQGEVAEACRRGEDAKHSAGKVPAIYKFLGKCYMRAGNATLAKDNYRHYLELAPNAPDAMFIESIVKESAK